MILLKGRTGKTYVGVLKSEEKAYKEYLAFEEWYRSNSIGTKQKKDGKDNS